MKYFKPLSAAMFGLCVALSSPLPAMAQSADHAVSDLAARVTRMEDLHDIQNVLGYYEEYQSALEFDKVVPLFALDQPDVRWEVGPGAYIGAKAVTDVLMVQQKQPLNKQWAAIHSGEMHVHTIATPIIVIAGDGKTAKVSFDSPGLETLSGLGHKPRAYRGWCRYGVDMIKTADGWKIWHMHNYGVIFSAADKSWVDSPGFPGKPSATDVGGEWPAPTRPQSDVWIYTGKGIPPLLPRPPVPYRTFSETFSY